MILEFATFVALMMFLDQTTNQSVSIKLYYESLCPYSRRIITDHLYQTFNSNLGKYMDVEFLPINNGFKYTPDGTGGWNFDCQHGPYECVGNLFQVCLLDQVMDKQIQMEAINCIMADKQQTTATEKCMNELNIMDFESVNDCHSSNYGENLFHQNILEASNLEPQLSWVPWVTFDGVWIDIEDYNMDFKQVLCTFFLNDVPECQGTEASSSFAHQFGRCENPTFRTSTGPGNNSYEAAIEILQEFPIIDGHNDFPLAIRELFDNSLNGWDFDSDLTQHPAFKNYSYKATDLPKLREGQVGGQFWSAFWYCGSQYKDATQVFMEQIGVIKRFVQKYKNDMTFVTDAQGIINAFKENKIASLIGVESGHAISSSLDVLRQFYELGVRYMTLTHTCNTPWADSSESEDGSIAVNNNGLSDFGEIIVKEMNRLGMLVDLAHVSSNTMRDALKATRAPLIFSHSSARSVANVTRNVPDDVLEKVKINRGIVMVNFYDCFVIEDCEEKNATVQDVVRHINHIRKITGVDHIGLGGDYNGVETFPQGLENVSKYPYIFAALLDDTEYIWTKEQLGKLASGNLIRVLQEVENVRDALSYEEPYQVLIPIQDLKNNTYCIGEPGLKRA